MSKRQAQKPSEILRDNVKKSGIPLTTISERTRISYDRLRRVIIYGSKLSLDEAIAIESVLKAASGVAVTGSMPQSA